MQVGQLIYRLYFKRKLAVYEKIDPEGCRDYHAVVSDIDRNLAFHIDPTSIERSSKNGFVNAFEQTGTKLSMNANAFIHYNPAQFIASIWR